MFAVWKGRVPREADLVCYWFVKAGEQVAMGKATRLILVANNSIRGGAHRRALQAATDGRPIFDGWVAEPWVIDSAAVRMSLVCFSDAEDAYRPEARMDGEPAEKVHSDLTARRAGTGIDLTTATRIPTNLGAAFMGDTKGGPFDVPGDLAREWLHLPANPNGRPNSDALKPWANDMDLTRRPADKWIVDFGWEMPETDAALYEAPFKPIREHVQPMRQKNRREAYRLNWWRHVEPRQGMWRSLRGMTRCIATARGARHQLFVWVYTRIVPDSKVIVVARDDDVTFGILHSRLHEAWSLKLCNWRAVSETSPSTIPTAVLHAFPTPAGLSPDIPAGNYANDPRAVAIAGAARRLVALRDCWFNPPKWVAWMEEPAPGHPRRPFARDKTAAKELRTFTLTNLYNDFSQWLADARTAPNAAVAAAYGWDAGISENETPQKLQDLIVAASLE